MKSIHQSVVIVSTLFAVATFAISPVQAQAEGSGGQRQQVYLHGFRNPSIGAEYRVGNVGFHTGLYTTILNRSGDSTEFFKTGVTAYFGESEKRRYEPFVGVSYLRGLNRDYKNRDGAFFEGGVRYRLTNRFEARLGVGVLTASGRPTKVNPTVGVSYRIPLN